MTQHLVWFRNDLRVADNPALYQACRESTRVRAVYIDCPGQWREHGQGSRQLDFIDRNLSRLQHALQQRGIELNRLQCDDFSQVPDLLAAHIQQQGISKLFANREIPVNERRRDRAVKDRLEIPFELFNGDCVISHGSLRTGNGQMYRVYTPFSKAWLAALREQGYRLYAPPDIIDPTAPANMNSDPHSPWPAGEDAAHQRLQAFCAEQLNDYQAQRDYPALDATSALSPYLAIGVLSPGQCLSAIEQALGYLPMSRGETGFSWLNELIWREFYRHLLVVYPGLSMHQPFKTDMKSLTWVDDEALFKAWCDGLTGYPIIDAAMRCLNQTSWMHNRLRMVVASFLTKDLQIDWRRGEAYFMAQLIDADLAANNGGWQWAAGTGADAAPYFRIFNPTTQGQRFDPEGIFVRRWLPELANVPDKHIHMPHSWLQQQGIADLYPAPVVDHALARQQTLARYQALKTQEKL